MNRLFRITFLLALLGVVLLVPAAAQAQGGNQVREDCLEDGKLDRDYPATALRSALGDAPSNEDEYGGDCREIIRQALANKTAGRSGSSAGAGGRPGGVGGVEGDQSADGIPDTDEDFDALQTAVRGGSDDDDDSGEGFSQPAPPFLSLGEETIVPKAPRRPGRRLERSSGADLARARRPGRAHPHRRHDRRPAPVPAGPPCHARPTSPLARY